MYARTFIILVLVVVASKVQAAAGLRGVVLANELSGPPMGNVDVSAVGDIAATLNNRALLDQDQKRIEEARKGFEEALKIRRELALKNPDNYLQNVAKKL